MRRSAILAALVVAAFASSVGHAAVSVVDLRANDVVFDDGVNRPDADRERLQRAADSLRGKKFPTKFVVVAKTSKDLDQVAAELRKGLADEVGIQSIDAVLVLGSRELGINADVFDSERVTAFQAEVATLRTDDIAGTINIANRLQKFDEAAALPGDDSSTSPGGGFSGWVIAALVAVGLAGVVGVVLARRAAKRSDARKLSE